MALFGAPIAHEDHAQRACFACLKLRDDMGRYAEEIQRAHDLGFSVRLGLNSGEVVVGTIGDNLKMDYTALGHTVGLAQRMEAMAEAGAACLTQHTAALVSGFFELDDLGEFDIKGVHDQLKVYSLLGMGPYRTHLDAALARGLTRFVGRGIELQTLHAAVESIREGEGQVFGVVSHPGVGKSRLCYEFVQHCREQGIRVYEAHGISHGKAIPLVPILELFRNYFGITEQETAEQAREKITDGLMSLDSHFEEVFPLLFEFLGVPDPDRPVPHMDPEARQRHLYGLLQRLVQSGTEAVVILLEDLHWFDPGSEAFLEKLVEAIGDTHVLLLVSFRPEFSAEWMHQSTYQQIALTPLKPRATSELLGSLLGSDSSLRGLAENISESTEGNPFFIEEVVQGQVEAGSLEGTKGNYRLVHTVEKMSIPSTVQAVLAARIDRLAEREKDVLQTAAVVGRTFSEAILRRVYEEWNGELDLAIRNLILAEFLYKTALYPEPEHAFKHALTHEVAYGSQLAERRARVHASVARAIEALYPDKLDERAALLAHHWEAAGDALAAVQWHSRAAVWTGMSNPAAAFHHWKQVRSLLEAVPESEEATALGIGARIQMLNFGWRMGMSEEEANNIFAEGRELAEQAEDLASQAFLHGVYGAACGMAGNVQADIKFITEATRLAEQLGGIDLQAATRAHFHYALYAIGRLSDAVACAERVIELTGGDSTIGVELVGISSMIHAVYLRALYLTSMGRNEEAEDVMDRGMQLAREHNQMEIIGWAHGDTVRISYYAGDVPRALKNARQAVKIAEKIGSGFSRVIAYGWLGIAHVLAEEWPQAMEVLEKTLKTLREERTGREREVEFLAWLAEACLGVGDADRARTTVEEAVALAKERGVIFQECLAQTSLARVLLRTDGANAQGKIKAALERALELVEESGGKMEEPFIRVELAELARLTGDADARERELREAHHLFTDMGTPIRAAQVEALLQEPGQ
jgi:adenylate cyclase